MGNLRYRFRIKRSAEQIKTAFIKKRKKTTAEPPRGIMNRHQVRGKNIGGFDCWFINQHGKRPDSWIIYIYGGALSLYPSDRQWEFAEDIMERTGTGVVVPMYPLAPEYSCRDTFRMLMTIYRNLTVNESIGHITLMGDETGAGLALSVCLQVWKEGFKKPEKLILISPSLDTEFFDSELEKKLILKAKSENGVFYSQGLKDYYNIYWVKDYAGMTEFTSPIYEDFVDVCDNILIISGTDGMFNAYAREFYNKAKRGGMNVMLYEYNGMKHNFIMNKRFPQTEHARRFIADIVSDSRENIINNYMYEVKQRSEWSKKFPEIFQDDIAVKYMYDNKITYEKYKNGQNDYRMLISAARQRAFDDGVRKFLMEYPEGSVVYLGCGMDTMFQRTDNGRVTWYNMDTPGRIAMRRQYVVSDNEREKTIDKTIFDYTWMDEIDAEMKRGLMFVCNNHFSYMKAEQVKKILQRISARFPGAFILFDVSSYRSMLFTNVYYRKKEIDFSRRRFYMDMPEREISNWNSNFKVISGASILDNIKTDADWSPLLKLKFRYARTKENYKLVHLRIGTEKYETASLESI